MSWSPTPLSVLPPRVIVPADTVFLYTLNVPWLVATLSPVWLKSFRHAGWCSALAYWIRMSSM